MFLANCAVMIKKFSEFGKNSSMLKGVDVFAVGTHRDGKTYTHDDLDQIVDNFNKFSKGAKPGVKVPMAVPRLMPGAPAVLGHEEEQEILDRSDLPAAGWPTKVWRDGDHLKADISGVAPSVANAIRNHRYNSVSAEIYDNPPDPIKGSGKMLRRISFLGADIPQVKTLDELPMPEPDTHAEQFAHFRPVVFKFREMKPTPKVSGCYTCFLEASPMSREEILKALGEAGADVQTLNDCSDEALAEMLRVLQGSDSDKNDDGQDMAGGDDDQGPGDMEQYIEKYIDSYGEGELPEPLDDQDKAKRQNVSRKMAELAKKMMEKYCDVGQMSKSAEDGSVNATTAGATPGMPNISKHPSKVSMQFNEQNLSKIISAEVTAAIKQAQKEIRSSVDNEINTLTKFREETLASEKKRVIEKFCEANGPLGTKKILPRELDRANPANIVDRLLRADAKTVVSKFRENGKDQIMTELDLQLREIEQRQPMRFNENAVKGGESGKIGTSGNADQEVEKVRSHFEKYSEHFKGYTEEKFVEGFLAAREYDPALTAEQFLPN